MEKRIKYEDLFQYESSVNQTSEQDVSTDERIQHIFWSKRVDQSAWWALKKKVLLKGNSSQKLFKGKII